MGLGPRRRSEHPGTVTAMPSQKVTWVLFFGTLLAVYVVAWRYA